MKGHYIRRRIERHEARKRSRCYTCKMREKCGFAFEPCTLKNKCTPSGS